MKIEEQVLSREQMAHLKELGVDTSDASMMWYRCDDGNAERWYLQINNELSRGIARIMKGTVVCLVPAYTIGDLVDKIPLYLNPMGFTFPRYIQIQADYIMTSYNDTYYRSMGFKDPYIKTRQLKEASLLQMLYEMLCFVAENYKELIK